MGALEVYADNEGAFAALKTAIVFLAGRVGVDLSAPARHGHNWARWELSADDAVKARDILAWHRLPVRVILSVDER